MGEVKRKKYGHLNGKVRSFSLRLGDKEFKRLEEISTHYGVSKNNIIRDCINTAYNQMAVVKKENAK